MFHGENTRPINSAPKVVSRKSSSHGVWTSRNSSTQMATVADISAIADGERVGAAIATRKNTLVPHSTDPPYFTKKKGSPRTGPNLRKARPQTMISRNRPARMIVAAPGVRSRVKWSDAVFMKPVPHLRQEL